MSIRVLLADDQSMVRAGLRLILDAEPDLDIVGEAADGVAAVRAAHRLRPHVILMDVRMPVVDGIEATRQITTHPDLAATVRVVALTTYDIQEYVPAALRAGACGYVLKSDTPELLSEAVRTAARGDGLISPAVTRRIIHELTATTPRTTRTVTGLDQLTPREHDVLVLVAHGLTNAEIGARLHLAESTVKTHVGRVLAKLHARDRVHAVILAHHAGLAEPPTHE